MYYVFFINHQVFPFSANLLIDLLTEFNKSGLINLIRGGVGNGPAFIGAIMPFPY